jgi:hypothetical protein
LLLQFLASRECHGGVNQFPPRIVQNALLAVK